MPVVSGVVLGPDLVPAAGAYVTARLVASVTSNPPGFVPTSPGDIVGAVGVTTKADGVWALTLTENALIEPEGTVYKFQYRTPGAGISAFYRAVGSADSDVDDLPVVDPNEEINDPTSREVVFSTAGDTAVGFGINRWYLKRNRIIDTVIISTGVAPQGSSLIVDVNLNGSSIWANPANRPTILAGTNESESARPDVTNLLVGNYLTVDVDQVGSLVPGSGLTVQITFNT